MVGFTEALNITGASTTVKPILQDLVVCCSGDDGISVGGKAQPLIRSCDVRVSCRALCWSHQQQHGQQHDCVPVCLACRAPAVLWFRAAAGSSGCALSDLFSLSCRCATVA